MREITDREITEMTSYKMREALAYNSQVPPRPWPDITNPDFQKLVKEAEAVESLEARTNRLQQTLDVDRATAEWHALIEIADAARHATIAANRDTWRQRAVEKALADTRAWINQVRAKKANCDHELRSSGSGLTDVVCLICGRRGQWGHTSGGHAKISWW